MANFDIEGHISDGKSLEWLAYAEGAETPQDVEAKVRQAAGKKFGIAVIFHRWGHIVSSNGAIVVKMTV